MFGNQILSIAKGCVDGCPDGTDETITTTTFCRLAQQATRPDGSGARVRATSRERVYFLGKLRDTTTTYTPEGAPATTTTTLLHTLELDRFHAGGGATALPPGDASTGTPIVWTNQYDAFGNLSRETGPNARCRNVDYDEEYDQLATIETIFTQGCDQPGALDTTAIYDRGFALVSMVLDMQHQPTKIEYDGFGRLTQLTRPHPGLQQALSPQPSVKIEYFLPPDLGSSQNPAHHSIIHTLTQDADDITDGSEYLESFSYVDGFGRTLVTLSEADLNAEDDAPWIAGSRVVYDDKGAVERKYLEYYYSGAPMGFPLAQAPSVPFGTQTYDAFGRQITTTDLDGTVTLYSAHHALSTDLFDAADLTPGPHTGTFATERRDGHGRTVATVERFHEGSTLRERETKTTFLPTNEPQVITRKLLNTNEQVTRWMRYDSLGPHGAQRRAQHDRQLQRRPHGQPGLPQSLALRIQRRRRSRRHERRPRAAA